MGSFSDELGISARIMRMATKGPNLEGIREYAADEHPSNRAAAALAFGEYAKETRDRSVFEDLVKLSFDDDLYTKGDALIALGRSRDSRAYFFLANYFERAEKIHPDDPHELRSRIILAFRTNMDPRATELLESAIGITGLKEAAFYALDAVRGNTDFQYTFVDAEAKRVDAMQSSGIPLTSVDDLAKIEYILEKDAQAHLKGELLRPQTYVVDLHGTFLMGGDVHEHVCVASGESILAGGEAYWEKDQDGWFIEQLNNRSNGYYPHQNSYIHVQQALEGTGIRFPKNFGETFPPRGWLDPDTLEAMWTTLVPKK